MTTGSDLSELYPTTACVLQRWPHCPGSLCSFTPNLTLILLSRPLVYAQAEAGVVFRCYLSGVPHWRPGWLAREHGLSASGCLPDGGYRCLCLIPRMGLP